MSGSPLHFRWKLAFIGGPDFPSVVIILTVNTLSNTLKTRAELGYVLPSSSNFHELSFVCQWHLTSSVSHRLSTTIYSIWLWLTSGFSGPYWRQSAKMSSFVPSTYNREEGGPRTTAQWRANPSCWRWSSWGCQWEHTLTTSLESFYSGI